MFLIRCMSLVAWVVWLYGHFPNMRLASAFQRFGKSAGGPLHSDLEGVSHVDGLEVHYSQICPKQAKNPLA